MADGLHLSPRHRTVLEALLREHLPEVEAWAYGSRVNGRSHDGSDLDLALRAPGLMDIPADQLAAFRDAVCESTIPFLVEAQDWAHLPDTFRREIERDHVALAERPADDWPVLTLRDAGVRLIDCVHKTPAGRESGYPYIGIPQMKNGWLDFEDARKISREDFLAWTKKAKPRSHDVVLSRRTNPGVTAVDRTGTEFALGQNLVLLRADGSRVEPAFLKWLVRSPAWWREIGKYLNVGAVFDSLRCSDVPSFELPIPPLADQRRIGAVLDALDDKIELNRRMNETLEAMARALFKAWFVDFEPVRAKMERRDTGLPQSVAVLFPDQLAENGLPVGWQSSTIGEHVSNFDALRVPVSGAQRSSMRGPFPYHGAAGVLDHVNDYLFDGTFLLLGEDGSVVRENGLAVTQYVSGQFWVNNHAHVLQGKGAVSTEQAYLHFAFEPIAPYVTGAVQPKLSQRGMNQIPFVYAGEAACRAFAQAVGDLFGRLRTNGRESDTLAAIRNALLPKLISGEIGIADAEKALEAVA